MNVQQNNALIHLAKEKFVKYAKDNPEKMNLIEFKHFLNDFFKDEKEVLEKIDAETMFKEFSKENSDSLTETEFREAYKDLKISRARTNDNIDFSN